MVKRTGASGTTIRRDVRILAIVMAIGSDRVAARAVGRAMAAAVVLVLKVARATRTDMRRPRLLATTVRTARWWLKTIGPLNRNQCELLRGL
jgi:hypothetical protein